MRHVSAVSLILALAARSCAATDKIDQYVAAELKRQHIPGLALGIYSRGNIVRAQGYGLANIELNVPVKPESIFQSGSVGKQFAATGIMMLVEEGKVNLNDSITKYFERAPEAWKPIKIKNLLSHTSGLAEYESGPLIKPGAPFYLRLDFTEDQLFDKVTALPMDFQPGEKWRYTNTNYLLLGMLIRKVTGQFYGDFLAERIFKPLGMGSTRIISEEDIVPNRTSGYRLVKGEWKNQEWVSPTFNSTADGAMYFNVPDLAKWDGALYTEKLIKKSSLDQMWTRFRLNDGKPNPGNYGFAWSIDEVNGHRIIQHGGAWQGFTTYIARYVDDGVTVVVLTNLDAGHSNPGKIAHAVGGLYDARLAPPVPRAIEDTEPQVTAFVRETVERIANGKADPAAFTPEARARFFPDRVKDAETFLKESGPVKRFELIERKQEDDGRLYRYRLSATESLILGVRIAGDGKIAGLSIAPE
jgi:CubicO group peptidase (beta-lactamase class C family)